MTRQTKAALHWIVGILRKKKIPFQISGGFAAKLYGSKRPLADIDIEVPDDAVRLIGKETDQYIASAPARYVDASWDLLVMTLEYKGQEIDICGIDSMRIFNPQTKRWVKQRIELRKAKRVKTHDIIIPVVPIQDLIDYKNILRRDVDIIDVNNLAKRMQKK